MKKIYVILILCLTTSFLFAQEFINPLSFTGTEAEKQAVIEYIQKNVKETYTAIGMGDPSTLRMMENEELKAFKELTKVKNKALLANVIATYCNIGMCSYSTFLMIYNEQLNASQQSLNW